MGVIGKLLGAYTGGILGGDHSQNEDFNANYGAETTQGGLSQTSPTARKPFDAEAFMRELESRRKGVSAGDGFLGNYVNQALGNTGQQDMSGVDGFARYMVNRGAEALDQKPAFKAAAYVRDNWNNWFTE
jgi:hypothetical protein